MPAANDRRVQRTHRDLKAALHELLGTHAYAAISVQDICDAANIGRATFYNHFQDKDALLWALLEDQFAAITAQLGTLDPETLLVDGKPLSYPAFAHVAQDQPLFRVVLGLEEGGAALTARLHDYLARFSYAAHAPLRVRAKQQLMPPEYTAAFLGGALVGVLRWWLAQGCAPDATTMAYRFSLLAAPGVFGVLGLDEDSGE
jgi:AcrR family transcriptional regulator